MIKNYKLVLAALLLSSSLSLKAQTWEYLEAPDVFTTTTNGGNADMFIASDNEVYVAFGSTSVSVKKFDGTSWEDLPTPLASGNGLGHIHVKKAKNSNDVFVAFANLSTSPYAYFVTVKKYDGSSWTQIGTTLQLPSGGSFFSFELDNNDVPVVIGSAQYSTQASNVHRFEGSAWVAYPIPNSSGSTFTYNSSFVDANNNVILIWNKSSYSVGTGWQTAFNLDTLTTTGLNAHFDNISIPYYPSSMVYLVNYNDNFSVYNTYTDAGYTLGILEIYDLVGGNFTSTSVDTVSSNAFSPIGKGPSGENYSGFQSKLYNVSDFNNPLYVPAQSSLLYRLRFSQNYAYILVNNGVVRSQLPLTSTTDINEKALVENNIIVYPNPTNGVVTIQLTNNSSTTIELYNVIGERLISEQINQAKHIIDISNYPNGVYFLKADGNITKIIKQ